MSREIFQRALGLGDARAAELEMGARQYWAENRRRIATAVGEAGAWLGGPLADRRPARVLDVGPSLEIVLLAELFPGVQLETMGWADHRFQPAGVARHHPLDLNATAMPSTCPRPEPFDLVLCLEVIEHLSTAPGHVLRYLRDCLRPGGVLLLSTPNAAFVRNRWRLLLGRNPFEQIREDSRNPGHFREYTRDELAAQLTAAGFTILGVRLGNLYDFGSRSGRRASRLADLLPGTFRHDMLFTVRRNE